MAAYYEGNVHEFPCSQVPVAADDPGGGQAANFYHQGGWDASLAPRGAWFELRKYTFVFHATRHLMAFRSITENNPSSFSAVTAVCFDPFEELLWTGLSSVRICLFRVVAHIMT
jgi:hypothetical protein